MMLLFEKPCASQTLVTRSAMSNEMKALAIELAKTYSAGTLFGRRRCQR